MNPHNEESISLGKVLIVEDNLTTRHILAKMVQEIGYTPVTAATGEEAKKRMALEEFALCLLDLNLPDTTGQLLCRYIRARSTVPLIVLSTEQDVDVIVQLLELGADDYIVKPVEFAVIKVTIMAQMRRAYSTGTFSRQSNMFAHRLYIPTYPVSEAKKRLLH